MEQYSSSYGRSKPSKYFHGDLLVVKTRGRVKLRLVWVNSIDVSLWILHIGSSLIAAEYFVVRRNVDHVDVLHFLFVGGSLLVMCLYNVFRLDKIRCLFFIPSPLRFATHVLVTEENSRLRPQLFQVPFYYSWSADTVPHGSGTRTRMATCTFMRIKKVLNRCRDGCV